MNEDSMQQNIQAKVLERVRERAHMHPRAYFVARLVLTLGIATFSLLLSVFVLSFIIFSVHESGEQFLLGFGGRGLTIFLTLFPWVALVADIMLLFVLEWLLQGFKIGYRFSLLTLFAGIAGVSVFLAIIVDATPLHSLLLDRADRGDLPFAGEMYERVHDSHRELGVFRGTVTSVGNGSVVISHADNDRDEDDGSWTVMLSPQRAAGIHVGDRLYVFGTSSGQTIQAYGVQPMSSDQ
jgi:hypothetical protein